MNALCGGTFKRTNTTPEAIGVGAGKVLRGEGFSPEFSQTCPKNFCAPFAHKFSSTKIMKTFFQCGLQKKVLMCFSAKVGRHFCLDFQGFCPDFQSFCQNFRQIKTFGGAIAPLPPTLLPETHVSSLCMRQYPAAGGVVEVLWVGMHEWKKAGTRRLMTRIGKANAVLRELYRSVLTKRELWSTAKLSALKLVFVPILT